MLCKSKETSAFVIYPLRLQFRVVDPIRFPALLSANVFRGAYGQLGLGTFVTPESTDSSTYHSAAGSACRPTPYIFRTRHLDGLWFDSGQRFQVDVHLFTLAFDLAERFSDAFARCATAGLGPLRSRVVLESVNERSPVRISLSPLHPHVRNTRITFVSPTELKHNGVIVEQPPFHVLFTRACGRIDTLQSLYGPEPLEIDFRALREEATQVRLEQHELSHVEKRRRSSRTGQVHPLGGFVGFADYAGCLYRFLPYLQVAQWTGVGRQTVWGKGEITIDF